MKNKIENKIKSLVLDQTQPILAINSKNLILLIYGTTAFVIPFLLGQPQLLIGSIVNALLVSSVLYGKFKNIDFLFLALLPSIGVLARGIIFGPFTIFLTYVLPIIWLGNILLIYVMKYFYSNISLNKWLSLGLSIIVKVFVLFAFSWFLVYLNIIPEVFLTTMGIIQLYTALIGGSLAIIINGISEN